MKIVKLDENIKNLNRVVDNQKINAVTEMNPVMSDAYEDSLETDEAIEKELKESDKIVTDEPFLGAKNQPLPEDPVLPKVTLDESLFEESLNEDANQRAAIYDDLVDYFDNWINDTIPTVPELVDAIPDYDGDWMIEIMTPEMNKAQDQYVKALANAAMTYYPDNVTEALDRSGEQRNDYFDFKQDVYDAISNVCKKYNNLSHEDIEDSVDWFLNMYETDEDIKVEECMNEDARPEKKQGKGIHKVKEEEDEDLWSLVYTSLIEHPDFTNYAANHAYNIDQLTDEERYEEVYTDYDGNIVVYGESEEKLLPAKRIADMYNLRATQSQSADSSRPEQKFKLTIIIPDEEIFDND